MSTFRPFPAMLMVIIMLAVVLLVSGVPTHLVVTEDPQLIGIRAVYVPCLTAWIRILKRPS